jgi:hypothetical protein
VCASTSRMATSNRSVNVVIVTSVLSTIEKILLDILETKIAETPFLVPENYGENAIVPHTH